MDSKYYLDSSFYVHLLTENPHLIPDLLISSTNLQAYTCVLTYDEVIWVVRKRRGKEASYQAADFLLALDGISMTPVTKETIHKSRELMEEYDLAPRDSIHLASAIQQQCTVLVSEDADFERTKGLSRISSKDFLQKLTKRKVL